MMILLLRRHKLDIRRLLTDIKDYLGSSEVVIRIDGHEFPIGSVRFEYIDAHTSMKRVILEADGVLPESEAVEEVRRGRGRPRKVA